MISGGDEFMFFAKLKVNILRDAQVARLRDTLWRRLIELYIIAVTEDADGVLPDIEDMAWQLHLEAEVLEAEMIDLSAAGFLDKVNGSWVFRDLKSWQYSQSPEARRQRKWRANSVKEKEPEKEPETELEKEIETEREIEGMSRTPNGRNRDMLRDMSQTSDKSVPTDDWWVRFLEDNAVATPDNEDDWELLRSYATVVWLYVTNRWPGYNNLALIVERLGDDPDTAALRKAYRFWCGSGFRRENVLGILEWYKLARDDPHWTPAQTRQKQAVPSGTSDRDIMDALQEMS